MVFAGHAACATESTVRLDAIKARGHVMCGISNGQAGFSELRDRGAWTGLEIDFCHALAAAVLGDRNAVKLVPVSAPDRMRALKGAEVDVLARGAPWTLSRETELGIRLAGVLFFDGHGFLVRRTQMVASALELSGASLCMLKNTANEQRVLQFFRARGMRVQLVTSERWENLVKQYGAEKCAALVGDLSVLALERSHAADPADHLILPELIGSEARGPMVRQGDEQWLAIVRWTLMALIGAEELGISSVNAETMRASQLPDVRRFLGLEANIGQPLGLKPDWAYQLVKQVGNYGELYERSLGVRSSLRLERGLNALWSKGGLMYAAPLR